MHVVCHRISFCCELKCFLIVQKIISICKSQILWLIVAPFCKETVMVLIRLHKCARWHGFCCPCMLEDGPLLSAYHLLATCAWKFAFVVCICMKMDLVVCICLKMDLCCPHMLEDGVLLYTWVFAVLICLKMALYCMHSLENGPLLYTYT